MGLQENGWKKIFIEKTGTLVCERCCITSVSNKITSLQCTLAFISLTLFSAALLKVLQEISDGIWVACALIHAPVHLYRGWRSSEPLLKMCWCYCCGNVWHFSVIVRNSLTALSSCSAGPSPRYSTLIWLTGCYKVHSSFIFILWEKVLLVDLYGWHPRTTVSDLHRDWLDLKGGMELNIIGWKLTRTFRIYIKELKFTVQTTVKCSFSIRFYSLTGDFSCKI